MAFLLDHGLEHVTALLPLAVVTTASRIKPRPVSTNTRAKPAPRVAALLARAAKAEASPARYRNLGEQEPPDGGSRPTRVPHGNATSHADRHGHDCPSVPAMQQPAGRPPPLATNAWTASTRAAASPAPPDCRIRRNPAARSGLRASAFAIGVLSHRTIPMATFRSPATRFSNCLRGLDRQGDRLDSA
jgi:hypothetical protein